MRAHLKQLTCPSCKSRNQLATAPDGGSPPKDHDAGLCITCGEWLIIDSRYDGNARAPTASEISEIAGDPLAGEMLRRWKQLQSEVEQNGGWQREDVS